MNIRPVRQPMSTVPGKIALVSAELLATDPVTAARRLLGARTYRARSVRGDRRGGGLRRPARRTMAGCGVAFLSRSADAQRGDVRPGRTAVHLPESRHPRVRERRERLRRRARGGAACARRSSTTASTWPVPAAAPRCHRVALARGPGNLCSALGITMDDNGIDLFAGDSPVRLDARRPTRSATSGPRVGVSQAADRPWRFWLSGHPEVSAYRRSPRAPAPGDSD